MGGLITTIDLTLDPDELESLDQQGSVAERIVGEALNWPGVYRAKGHFGSVVLRVGRRELGHLHGGAVADVPVAPPLGDQVVKEGPALEREPGWVSVPLETEEGIQQALALLRANYERRRAREA
jgi:Family of unknown function (DUF5519)